MEPAILNWLPWLFFFSPWNVRCFPITMKNVIRNKSFIKLNTRPQCKLWRPQSCLRGISQDSLQRSFNPISHPSGSTHFTQGTKNWHLQRNSRSLSILLTKRNPNLLGLISHDDSSFFHVEPSTGGCKNLKRQRSHFQTLVIKDINNEDLKLCAHFISVKVKHVHF